MEAAVSTKEAIEELMAQRNRIDQAIAALTAINSGSVGGGVKHQKRLDATTKASILARFSSGERANDLALEFGISRAYVYQIRANHRLITRFRDKQPDTNATAIGVQ